MGNKRDNDWIKIGILLAYSISILLLLFVFFANRSLFLDSLNLARNIAEGTFSDFFKPLKYQQSAPFLFLTISKIFTLVFGISEYSLRLFPLICGLLCLFFYGGVLKRLVHPKYVIPGILWLGTHAMFIRYATEFKQYITDAFVCTFLIWAVLKIKKLEGRNTMVLGIAGTLAIWMSMPSVFVLFSIIIYYFYTQYNANKTLRPILLIAAWFVLNFILEYFLILRPAITSEHMQNFHQHYFIQGRFWKLESLQHDFGLLISTVRLAVGKSGIAIAVAIILMSLSIYNFVKKEKSIGIILTLPLLVVFITSLLGKYSLIERLMLFTLPIQFLLIINGLQIAIKNLSIMRGVLKYPLLVILALAIVTGFTQTQGLKYLINPLEIEDNRSALIYIDQHAKRSNTIICTQLAFPAYSYYTSYDSNMKNTKLGKAVAAKYNESIVTLATNQSIKENQDVWILMGHMLEDEITHLITALDKIGTIKNSYRTNRSAAILFSTQ